ncbi:MAG: NfeD family protein [Clostridia bacterium]|nr:NfeD family protein [Clostridia bacterium]
MVWIWAVVTLSTLVAEVVTVELACIWFTFGGLVSFILALCGVGEVIQIIVFLVVAVLSFASLRPVCKKLLKDSNEKTNVESVIGTTHTLLSEIAEDKPGEIKINGVSWRVISKDKQTFAVGEKVKIVEVQGNKFLVEKGEE